MLKSHTVNGFIDLAHKHSRKPKQLSQRSKNIVTLQKCPLKSQEMSGGGGRAGKWPHLERGHGFWHFIDQDDQGI